jgi:phenylalanyl-tRNA synthetase alpha chain
VLRSIEQTLTDTEANTLRDRVYAALHQGPAMEMDIAASER